MKPPVLIETDLLGSSDEPVRAHWLPLLSGLNQAERPLVLLAERPNRWTPTRSRVDRAFMRQATIEADVRRAGGALDAVIYLDFGLFTRKHQYRRNLADLASRYDAELKDVHAIVRPGKFADALGDIIGSVDAVSDEAGFEAALKAAVDPDSAAQ